MKNILLKNVEESDWMKFKTEAITHGMNMGEFLSHLIKEHLSKKHSTDNWKEILSWRSGRTSSKFDGLLKEVAETRKKFKFER